MSQSRNTNLGWLNLSVVLILLLLWNITLLCIILPVWSLFDVSVAITSFLLITIYMVYIFLSFYFRSFLPLFLRCASYNLGWENPLEKKERLPTPVFWPGEFYGLYTPWDHKESDMTERLSLHFTSYNQHIIISVSLMGFVFSWNI